MRGKANDQSRANFSPCGGAATRNRLLDRGFLVRWIGVLKRRVGGL